MRILILFAAIASLANAQKRIPVWIDTDPSVAPGGHEVDDGIALLQAFASPELDIRGISVVFGNADLATASRIGIDRIVAVAGRRPGQHFRSGPSQKAPFRDLNFELDPEAFRILLASRVPLALAPWEISSGVWLNREELQAAAARNPAMGWMLPAATDWLDLWKREFGARGFNPFDALAVGVLVHRQSLKCERLSATIETAPDDTATSQPAPDKPYLLVRPSPGVQATVTYCSAADPDFKSDLLRRLGRATR